MSTSASASSLRTTDPASRTTLAVPLFRTARSNGPTIALLGQAAGRIRLATSITVDSSPPVPGVARLGAIGLDVDLPTSTGGADPVFGLSLDGFQLPGAQAPRSLRIAADGFDELDDALLDLVLSLVREQALAAGGTALGAVAGLLGLGADAVPDFPITEIPTLGVHALAAWMEDLISSPASRQAWLDHLAVLLEGSRDEDTVAFDLGGDATLHLGIRVDTGPSGNTRLTPTLGVELGNDDARVEARADLCTIDLVTGAAVGLPALGIWAAAGRPGNLVLDVDDPIIAQADTLRLGFALDAARRLTFVLAADGVVLGDNTYATLDLTSPDAVMDAAGATVAEIAGDLLGGLGGALATARLLLGLDPAGGADAVGLTGLLTDPVGAVAAYWDDLVTNHAPGVGTVLLALRDAVADAAQLASPTIPGTGTAADPWRVPLVGPLELEVRALDGILSVGVAAVTRVDQLGQRCTVIETRLAATLVELDLGARSASLLPGVDARLSARERGVTPPRVTLPLGEAIEVNGRRRRSAPGVVARRRAARRGGRAGPAAARGRRCATDHAARDRRRRLGDHAARGVGRAAGAVRPPGRPLPGLPPRRRDDARLGRPGAATPPGARRRRLGLRLADLVDDPAAALAAWLPQLALSELGPAPSTCWPTSWPAPAPSRRRSPAAATPTTRTACPLGAGVPEPAVWFPPAGLEPRVTAVSPAVRRWRPGDPGLDPVALVAALEAEAAVAADVRELIEGRDVLGGLAALAERWVGGDGRILPPAVTPAGVTIDRSGLAAGQLHGRLDVEDLLGRVPATIVHVALGPAAWPDPPAGRRVDLTAPGLTAAMFAMPTAATGEWFVALGDRAACRPPGSTSDGTPEQAARLAPAARRAGAARHRPGGRRRGWRGSRLPPRRRGPARRGRPGHRGHAARARSPSRR